MTFSFPKPVWWCVDVVPPGSLTFSPLKMDAWKMSFLLGLPMFRGYVKLREGIFLVVIPYVQRLLPRLQGACWECFFSEFLHGSWSTCRKKYPPLTLMMLESRTSWYVDYVNSHAHVASASFFSLMTSKKRQVFHEFFNDWGDINSHLFGYRGVLNSSFSLAKSSPSMAAICRCGTSKISKMPTTLLSFVSSFCRL